MTDQNVKPGISINLILLIVGVIICVAGLLMTVLSLSRTIIFPHLSIYSLIVALIGAGIGGYFGYTWYNKN